MLQTLGQATWRQWRADIFVQAIFWASVIEVGTSATEDKSWRRWSVADTSPKPSSS